MGVIFTLLISQTNKKKLKNKISGLSGDRFHFDSNGDGPARYNIIHFKQVSNGKYRWIRVGEYNEGVLKLNMSGKNTRIVWWLRDKFFWKQNHGGQALSSLPNKTVSFWFYRSIVAENYNTRRLLLFPFLKVDSSHFLDVTEFIVENKRADSNIVASSTALIFYYSYKITQNIHFAVLPNRD